MTIYDHQKPVTGPLSFRHFYTVEYRPGEDELINYRAKKRRNGAMNESVDNGCSNPNCECDPCECDPCECEQIDEALTLQQRMKRGRLMKRMKARIKIGRERARRKMADKKKLQKRANRKARDMLVRKLTKDIPKSELSFARRQEIEKRLDKPALKARIKMIAKRMFPKVRRAEMQRKKG